MSNESQTPAPGEGEFLPRVTVCLPVYGDVTPHTMAGCLALSERWPGRFDWHLQLATDVGPARNAAARACDNPLFLSLDADMVFNADTFAHLEREIGRDPKAGALSALYFKRDGSGLPVCNWRDGEGWLSDEERVSKAKRQMGTQPVDSCGGGFLLVTREALDAVGEDPFKAGYDEEGNYYGEDTGFCQRLQEAGFEPSVAFHIQVGHIGRMMFGDVKYNSPIQVVKSAAV